MAKTWLFDLVHYPYDVEPERFDPEKAAEVYDFHLKEWGRADDLGYDGLFLGEHHFTAYNMTPSPNVMLAAAAQHAKRMRLGIMINVLPFHDPLRLAEEIAMLDLLTHGRLECGLGRGVDAQEFVRLTMPMEEARPRFTEGLELMKKAWTETGFSFDGQYTKLSEASIYPRPLQQPHPPIWITALSPDTIDWAATEGYPMASIFMPATRIRADFDRYEAAARAAGRPVGPENFMLARNVYVADTEEQAIEEVGPAFSHLFGLFTEAALPTSKRVNKSVEDFYAGHDEYGHYREFFRPFVGMELTLDQIRQAGLLITGSPEQVRDQCLQEMKATGAGHFMSWMCFGNLGFDQVTRSEELFAQEVLPALRELP
ncbi:MAG: hypothetical protein QOJ23_5809 [Actinomycetota bacterium]|nr:hypothetical protein [Actinomycetota bacterium]